LRRFLVLTALRWLPPGLLIPVFVLLPLDRGLSLGQLGVAAAMQGFVVFALELPAGGLADSIGRRRVLLASMVVAIASIGLFLIADTFAVFAAVFALQGVHRALDSGPLEAWYVDAAQTADPHTRIDRGMSAHGTVLGLSVAAGAITSGGIVALDPVPGVNPLVTPVALALAMQVVGLLAVILLMAETPPNDSHGVRESVRATPRTITAGVGLLRSSPVLLALVAVELLWGFGTVCFEGLMPVRLAEVAGGIEAAAALTGPAASAAWLASAAGSAALPWLGRTLGIAPTAALMRLLQGLTVAAMGIFGGVLGILAAYLACYAIHGTSNAAHMTLLHRQATGPVRATVVSLNSMVHQPAGALGMIALTALAQTTAVSTAMYVGGVILAAAAPLYLPAWRQHRTESTHQPSNAAVVEQSE
jgi:MFS family permease